MSGYRGEEELEEDWGGGEDIGEGGPLYNYRNNNFKDNTYNFSYDTGIGGDTQRWRPQELPVMQKYKTVLFLFHDYN